MKRQLIIITQTFALIQTGGLCTCFTFCKNRFIRKPGLKIRLQAQKNIFFSELHLYGTNQVKIQQVFPFFLFLPTRRINETYQTFAWI